MFDIRKLQERSHNDQHFSVLVQMMEGLILENGYGMTEFREAAFLATSRHVARFQRNLFVPNPDKDFIARAQAGDFGEEVKEQFTRRY